jgi:Flp pilus assembly pilin Flp
MKADISISEPDFEFQGLVHSVRMLVGQYGVRAILAAVAGEAAAANEKALGYHVDTLLLADDLAKMRDASPRGRDLFNAAEAAGVPTLNLARDECGQTTIEFGLLLAVLGPVMIYGGRTLGPAILDWANALVANIATAQHLIATLGGCA